MIGEFMDSSLDPKKTHSYINGFTWPGNAWNFVYPSWEDCLYTQILEVEMVDLAGPVKTHLTTKCPYFQQGGKLTNAWEVDILLFFFCFFQVLGFNRWNIDSQLRSFVRFLLEHSPSIATSRTWLKPVVCKSWTQIALVSTLASWNITEPLEGQPTKQGG